MLRKTFVPVLALALVVDGDVQGFADYLELFDGGGTVDVAGYQQGLLPEVRAQVEGQLAAGGGLARALQAHHQDLEGRGALERRLLGLAAEQGHQLVVEDLDHHLARGDRAEDVLAEGLFLDVVDEGLDDLEVHVGIEQRAADLAQSLGDVLLGQAGLTADAADRFVELGAEILEHS